MVGWLSAVSSAYGHELTHRKNTFDKVVGQWIFTKRLYGHYAIDHWNCHHKRIGTAEDHETAYKNEPLYGFVLRSCMGTLKGATNYEIERIQRKYKNKASLCSLIFENAMVYHLSSAILLLSIVYNLLGY